MNAGRGGGGQSTDAKCAVVDTRSRVYRLRKTVREFGMEKLDDEHTRRRLVAFEAYDVLSDPYWRGVYDRFGEIVIKKGVFVDDGPGVKRYAYHGDIFLTYK